MHVVLLQHTADHKQHFCGALPYPCHTVCLPHLLVEGSTATVVLKINASMLLCFHGMHQDVLPHLLVHYRRAIL